MSRTIKPNNKKAPRFRRTKGAYVVISRELFKRYKQKYPESTIDYKTFSGFLLEYTSNITTGITEDRDGFKIPYNIGHIFIGAYKPRKKLIDYQKSQELGIEVRLNNFNTNGKVAKIFYTTFVGKYKMPNRKMWMFKPCRQFTQKVKTSFRENFNFYKEVSYEDKIWKKVLE